VSRLTARTTRVPADVTALQSRGAASIGVPERKRITSEHSLVGMDADAVPADQKRAIAAAVRAALATHGYARLTTAKIAAESEKSEAGLYYYYDSKDEMIVAFLEEAAGSLARDLEAVEGGPEERLRAACDRLFVRREDEDARGLNVAIMELLSHAPYNERLREPLLALEGSALDTLEAIVREGVERGTFRDVPPRGTAAFLLAAGDGSTGFYLALGMEDVGDPLRERAAAYVDWLVDG
jgi:AcrR family transcriptional regulator